MEKIEKALFVRYKHENYHCPEDDFDTCERIDCQKDLVSFIIYIEKWIASMHRKTFGLTERRRFSYFTRRYVVVDGVVFWEDKDHECPPPLYAENAFFEVSALLVRAKTMIPKLNR